MNLVGNAIAIAAEVHKDQTDKSKDPTQPYILHCLEVMRRAKERYLIGKMTANDAYLVQEVMCVAVLHDVLEDFEGEWMERKRLQNRIYDQFPNIVTEALEALTRQEHGVDGPGDVWREPYEEYIERVSRSWLARLVKLCDLSHNLEAWRIPSGKITERDYKRWDKYHRAFVRLMRED